MNVLAATTYDHLRRVVKWSKLDEKSRRPQRAKAIASTVSLSQFDSMGLKDFLDPEGPTANNKHEPSYVFCHLKLVRLLDIATTMGMNAVFTTRTCGKRKHGNCHCNVAIKIGNIEYWYPKPLFHPKDETTIWDLQNIVTLTPERLSQSKSESEPESIEPDLEIIGSELENSTSDSEPGYHSVYEILESIDFPTIASDEDDFRSIASDETEFRSVASDVDA
jgi:hypothetical protein